MKTGDIIIESITINGDRYNAVAGTEEDSCDGCDLDNLNECIFVNICNNQNTIFKKEKQRMRIKYESDVQFDCVKSITPCPNNYEEVKVYSEACSECNFYKGKSIFGQSIKCSYDKYHNKEERK